MMQQPVFQQEQAGNQVQQQQQMLLCPVRLVYETQILVQPGDQIQPNQTIVINPQNQPPWAQNRVQNQQVIYVQNMANSFMPQVHQIDQNQMFLQQNYGFPQVIQHPMITQNQEQIRTIQMGNPNMQSQLQANIAQIMPNERMVTHNFSHVQVNPGINVQNVVQNQIANVPINTNNRQIQNVPKATNEMPNNSHKPQEVQISTQQNYRQITHHPITHQMNLVRAPTHQTIAMIPMPNMVHRPNLEPNTGQMNTVPQQAIVQTANPMQATFTSSAQNVQMEPRKAVPIMQKVSNQNMQNTVSHNPKNQAYSYRPIQPRPQQFRSNVPLPNNSMTVQPNMNIQIQQNQNVVDNNRMVAQNIANSNYQKVENTSSNHQFNRKRKSESPDDIQRKLTIVPATNPTNTSSMTVKRLEPTVSHSVSVTKVNTHEIGVNTNPVMKMNSKISTNNRNMIQISPLIDQNAKIKEELAKPIHTTHQAVKPPMTVTNITNNNPLPNMPNMPNISGPTQGEKEKLVRNTVFPQARFGRVLTDKVEVPVSTSPTISTTSTISNYSTTSTNPTISNYSTASTNPIISNYSTANANTSLSNYSTANTNPSLSYYSTASTNPTISNYSTPIANPTINNYSMPSINPTSNYSTANTIPTLSNYSTASTSSTISTNSTISSNLTGTTHSTTNVKQPKQEKLNFTMNTNSTHAKDTRNVDVQKDIGSEKKLKAEKDTDVEMKVVENKDEIVIKKEEKPMVIDEVKEEKPQVFERCAEEKMLSDSMNRLKGNETNEIKLKSDKDYILTHVLDGFVIQESNVAFPIRLPLKEKSIGINTGVKAKANIKEDITEDKDKKPDKVPDLSHLHLNENERLKTDSDKKEFDISNGNPFTDLKLSAVKSWTVEQLALHLSKYNWHDTISVLQEHEIDGESLFLVSKSQLVSIGVKETHADVICEFVKS